MPPRVRFNRDMIVDAALRLAREGGLSAVSARSVAAELGCSTGPVFSNFDTMEALTEALIDRIIDRFVQAMTPPGGTDPLMVAGTAMVRFAADEPRLYEALFLTHHPYHAKWGPVRRQIADWMGDHPRYQELDERARFGLVGRASVVAHGLGVEIWSGRLGAMAPEQLQQILTQLASPIIDAALERGWTEDIHSTHLNRTSS
jgi:AcrR family transcriptional regulator